MSVERWESREPVSTVKPDRAMLRKMEREAFFASARLFGTGILVIITIAAILMSAGALASFTGVAALGTFAVHLFVRWISSRE